MRIRSKLALILFGMILGALSYRGLSSLVVDRAPAVTQLAAADEHQHHAPASADFRKKSVARTRFGPNLG